MLRFAQCLISAIVLFSDPAMAGKRVLTTRVELPQKNQDISILEGPKRCGFSLRHHGLAHISQQFAGKLLEKAGFLTASSSMGALVRTTVLTETTARHKDFRGDGEPVTSTTPAAFLALNTNPDAYFSHGDEHFPIVEGQLFQFDGSVEHNTVVNSGVVELLGPFDLPSFVPVGISGACCYSDDNCTEVVEGDCPGGFGFGGEQNCRSDGKCPDVPDPPCEARSVEECCQYGNGIKRKCFLCPEELFEEETGSGRNLGQGRRRKKPHKKTHKPSGSTPTSCNLKCVDAGRFPFLKEGDPDFPFTLLDDTEKEQCSQCVESPGFERRLAEGKDAADMNPTRERVLEIISEHGADPEAPFSHKHGILSKTQCDSLIEFVEAAFVHEGEPWFRKNDLEKKQPGLYEKIISLPQLVELIGDESIFELLSFFEESMGEEQRVTKVYASRHASDANDNQYFVPWHKDSYAVLEVALNDDYTGGELIHLTGKGVEKVDSRVGTAMVHGPGIVHGITPNSGAPRYSFILKNQPMKKDNILTKDMVNEYLESNMM